MAENTREDRLVNYRDVTKRNTNVFFNWLSRNCLKAVSVEEARKLTQHIKKPIRKEVDNECL